MQSTQYRPDIDGLRAFAVFGVVAFHAFPNLVSGGFIGVDIFFVISGYLICSNIFKDINTGSFSLTEFYARRIRRIFPALLLVLTACYLFGWFALLEDEFNQLNKHIFASSGFAINFVLMDEAGYFDNSGETKPLLHLWSLAIEEQFYIVYPLALLIFLKLNLKSNILIFTIIITIFSFYISIKIIEYDIVKAFYSPQSRFWELLIGSLLAYFEQYKKNMFANIKVKIDTLFLRNIYSDVIDI
jgi:peptidoglycan/LPS O-acetylase OafA/YrhL